MYERDKKKRIFIQFGIVGVYLTKGCFEYMKVEIKSVFIQF